MEITEVKVVLKEGPDKKLKAYATITLDNCFVVRNIKVIKGNKGLFVAMPSRKMREACPKCHYKNAMRSKFCNQCGANLPVYNPPQQGSEEPRQSEHKDIAHPITLECREYIQKKVLEAYGAESGSPRGEAGSPRSEAAGNQRVPPSEAPAKSEAAPLPRETRGEVEKRKSVEDEGDIEL